MTAVSDRPDVEPSQRERTAMRLLASSARNSYDPLLDIDWAAPVADGMTLLPPERVSLYGTSMWERMTAEQRVELARHELASIAGTGLWFEIVLVQMLARYAYHQDPQAAHTHYALTEVGDETRHIIMFAKAIARLGLPTYRPRAHVHQLARLYKATARGPAMFAPTLIAEEMTDRLQRATMNDETIDPLVRMVNRIHVVEEARHVRFAREEVQRVMAGAGPAKRIVNSVIVAAVGAFVATSLVHPAVYEAVGLDRREAVRAARRNPHNQATRRWLAEKIMGFLTEQGLVTFASRPIYRRVHLL